MLLCSICEQSSAFFPVLLFETVKYKCDEPDERTQHFDLVLAKPPASTARRPFLFSLLQKLMLNVLFIFLLVFAGLSYLFKDKIDTYVLHGAE